MFPCLLSFPMFMFGWVFALAGLATGLGEDVTIEFALELLFEFSAVLQPTLKTAIGTKARKAAVFRMLFLLCFPKSTNVCAYVCV